MLLIMPIKDLRNTTEISKLARINRIDQAVCESEQEIAYGAEAVDAEIVLAALERKHFDQFFLPDLFCAIILDKEVIIQ